MASVGGLAESVAQNAVSKLQALAQAKMCKRPGTGARLNTGSTRLGTGMSRPGTGMNSTGRLSTASRSKTSAGTGNGFRPPTGSAGNNAIRLGTSLGRQRDADEESDNSV